jgi:hypothetical protein
MTLTPSELASLNSKLICWERGEYVFALLVAIACFGEYVASFTNWITNGSEKRKESLEKRSTHLLIVALVCELVCLVKTNQLSGKEIGSLNEQSQQALDNAKTALTDSSSAIRRAGEAATTAGIAQGASSKALDTSKQATGAASNALSLARGARQELGAVELQVNDAKSRLSDAQAKAVDAEERAQKAQSELINLAICNSPRVIPEWMAGGKTTVDPLLPMAGQKVLIEFVPETEARRAAFNLANVLVAAKWDVQQPLRIVDGLKDGVSVQTSLTGTEPSQNGGPQGWGTYVQASNTAEKLVEFLHSYNWQANGDWPESDTGKLLHDPNVLPAGAIRIQIGLYPAVVFVSPPGQQELTIHREKDMRDQEKYMAELKRKREEALAETKRQIDEQFKTSPPEVREQQLKRAEDFFADMNSKDNMKDPCQALSPLP